ncbi:hypothetical protein KXD93_25575 [Mucilaginibacter sp. BJC16-A38]|uniref:hypothetical protein n=1 Tax=Mucilaginibacter phenanthrenivorans TaxID=1234842 RepID=UPI0021583957|nr:hypothetical protein [Mucilaginibacter phenanthrenivorans]MCR8561053.1 hypothetical protein [Mucilaginibacter phenanthrenivorans]
MKTLSEFFFLVVEYCFFPIALFVFTSASDSKEHNHHAEDDEFQDEGLVGPQYMTKLKTSGHEFVLIEGFALISILVRIGTDKTISVFSEITPKGMYPLKICYLLACLLWFYMFIIFFKGILLRGRKSLPNTKIFKENYFSFFFAWWYTIIILGIYSGFILDHLLTSILVIVASIILSYVEMEKILYTHFISFNVMYREVNDLINTSEYRKAQRKGVKLLERLNNENSSEYYDRMVNTVIDVGTSYFLDGKDENSKKFKRTKAGINFMLNFVKNPAFSKMESNYIEKNMFYYTLAGLYYKAKDLATAIKIISENITDELDRNLYIDCINSHSYNKIIRKR